uniref:Uncharacterized protein n=1 Tax=Arundo donax TaxID=35708 RepID=A0A0A9EQ49_ARUDO
MNSAGAREEKKSGSTGCSLSQFIFFSICVSTSRYSAEQCCYSNFVRETRAS